MFSKRIDLGWPLAVIELLARVGSIASITLLLIVFLDDALHPSKVAPREWLGLLFFPIGITIGMVVAWWKEGAGSVLTLGSLGLHGPIHGISK